MKFFSQVITIGFFLISQSMLFAANDTSTIELQVTEQEYLQLVGSAVGSDHVFNVIDIDNKTVSLGTLGIQSNIAGNCMMIFSSFNQFKMKNMLSGDDLGVYSLKYQGNTYTAGTTNFFTQPCNVAATPLELASPDIPDNVTAGIYYGVIVVTVVTQ